MWRRQRIEASDRGMIVEEAIWSGYGHQDARHQKMDPAGDARYCLSMVISQTRRCSLLFLYDNLLSQKAYIYWRWAQLITF